MAVRLGMASGDVCPLPDRSGLAFVFGVTFSFYWRKLPHDFFDRDTVGLEYPIGFGMLAVEAMLFIGVFSTMVYGCFAYWLFRAGNQDGE